MLWLPGDADTTYISMAPETLLLDLHNLFPISNPNPGLKYAAYSISNSPTSKGDILINGPFLQYFLTILSLSTKYFYQQKHSRQVRFRIFIFRKLLLKGILRSPTVHLSFFEWPCTSTRTRPINRVRFCGYTLLHVQIRTPLVFPMAFLPDAYAKPRCQFAVARL